MKWNKIESRQVIFYTGDAKNVSFKDALFEVWHFFIAEIIPLNKDVDWDQIKIEFWADSGRIILYPASRHDVNRIEKAGCQVVFPTLLKSYEDLADSEIDDDEFCERLTRILNTWVDALTETAENFNLPKIKLSFWDSECETAFRELDLNSE